MIVTGMGFLLFALLAGVLEVAIISAALFTGVIMVVVGLVLGERLPTHRP